MLSFPGYTHEVNRLHTLFAGVYAVVNCMLRLILFEFTPLLLVWLVHSHLRRLYIVARSVLLYLLQASVLQWCPNRKRASYNCLYCMGKPPFSFCHDTLQ